jgi:hypothetical protein
LLIINHKILLILFFFYFINSFTFYSFSLLLALLPVFHCAFFSKLRDSEEERISSLKKKTFFDNLPSSPPEGRRRAQNFFVFDTLRLTLDAGEGFGQV